MYSTNPDIVMRWLCDGWRCRYNQLRSRRTKWDRESQTAVPLNGRPDMRSDRQVRIGMLLACGHPLHGVAIPEQDREHGLVECEQAS